MPTNSESKLGFRMMNRTGEPKPPKAGGLLAKASTPGTWASLGRSSSMMSCADRSRSDQSTKRTKIWPRLTLPPPPPPPPPPTVLV